MARNSELVVAFQGAPGAYSHRAVQLFASDLNKLNQLTCVSCKSFEEVFEKLSNGDCTHGVVPLENSSVGTIVSNYDLIGKNSVELIGELYLPIHHNLIGFPDAELDQIVEISSHPVALDQCRNFLKSMAGAKAVPYWDTAASAFHVKEMKDKKLAAIASEYAAKETGLTVLRQHIEDHSGNNTRFGIVTRPGDGDSQRAIAPPFKISCVVELEHKPGALAELLLRLSKLGVNLTKIESRPIPEAPWHYRFFLDVEVKSHDVVEQVTDAIASMSESHKIIGRYKAWQEQA